MNNTKKSLWMSSISLLLCISMFIGSTFAWFTDSVSSAVNKIQSGTLKVDVELLDKETGKWNSLKNTQAPIFNYDKWEPGYVDTKVLKVENEGNLALKWVAKFYSEYELSILADVIDVYVRPSDIEIGYPTDRNLEGYTCVGNLRTFINSIEDTTCGTLEADEVSYLGIGLKMREEAGNEYQGLSLGGAFDIRIYATQCSSEYDSFGNEYDQGVTFDEMANTSIMATASKTLVAGAKSVDFDLSSNGLYVAKVIVPASAIADSSQPVTVTFDGIKPSEAAIIDENTQAYAFDIKVTNLKDNLAGDQLVTVIVTAPNALAAMKAYHNGTLIEDAVYDEVEGTITFKTANFSPFEFTTQEYEVSDLTELRKKMNIDGAYVKLTKNIAINLSAGSADRDINHALQSSKTYYNAVKIQSKNVAIDLNGYSITVECGEKYNSNSDVGALFFVGENGSLNIINTGSVSTGFIKMKSSIYAVWAPFSDPSYVDIYGGAFIADSYADDPIGTSTNPGSADGTMKNENSNRALIYAGFGGNMNIYGGYFLYNNTPNDVLNRNNGAFNAKDHYTGGPLITIHEGVFLSNKEYRQNPANTSTPHGTFDDESIKLVDENYYQVSPVKLNEAVVINGVSYEDWYKVSRDYKYKVIFMDNSSNILDTQYILDNGNAVTVDGIDDTACGNLDSSYTDDFGGWVNAASEKVDSIDAHNTKDIVLYPSHSQKYTVRFVDQFGNVISSQVFTNQNINIEVPEVPKIDGFSGEWDSYDLSNAKGDITVRPIYTFEGNLSLTPIDNDNDGVVNYYQVDGFGEGDDKTVVKIPAYVNGVPVEHINSNAFSSYNDLHSVVIPSTLTGMGEHALPGTWNLFNKGEDVTLYYEGTYEEWIALEESFNTNWDEGVGKGSRIFFMNGTGKVDPSQGYLQANHETNWIGTPTGVEWKKVDVTTQIINEYKGTCSCDSCNGKNRPDKEYWEGVTV